MPPLEGDDNEDDMVAKMRKAVDETEEENQKQDIQRLDKKLDELRTNLAKRGEDRAVFAKTSPLIRSFLADPENFPTTLKARVPEDPHKWWDENHELVKKLPRNAYYGPINYLEAVASGNFTEDESEALYQGLALRYELNWSETKAIPMNLTEAMEAQGDYHAKVEAGVPNVPYAPVFKKTGSLYSHAGLTEFRRDPLRYQLNPESDDEEGAVYKVLKLWEEDVVINKKLWRYKFIPHSWAKKIERGWYADFMDTSGPLVRTAVFLGVVTFNLGGIAILLRLLRTLVSWVISYITPTVQEAYSDKAVRKNARRVKGSIREGRDDDRLPMDKRVVRLFRYKDEDVATAVGVVYDDLHLLVNAHVMSSLMSQRHETLFYVEQPRADGSPGTRLAMQVRKRDLAVVKCGLLPDGDTSVDCVLVRLSSRLANARASNKHFPTIEFVSAELEGFSLIHHLVRKGKPSMEVLVEYGVPGILRRNETRSPELKSDEDYRDVINVAYKWTTNQRTVPGDCGSPYIYKNKIVGIHYGKGNDGMGLYVPLTKEAVEDAFRTLQPAIRPSMDEPQILDLKAAHREDFNPDFDVYRAYNYETGKRLANNVPTNTGIKPSVIASDIPDDGHLPSRKDMTVLMEQTQKYSEELDHIPPPMNARDWAIGYFRAVFDHFPNAQRGSLPMYEVLNGNADLHLKPIDITTSAGYWNMVSRGKRDLVDRVPGDDGEPDLLVFSEGANTKVHPVLGTTFAQALSERRRLAREGDYPDDSIWLATLKDELLPKAKVASRGAREFQNPPFDYNLVWKEHFGTFESFMKCHPGPLTMSAIGMYPLADWPHFIDGLSDSNTKRSILCEDYSRWDSNMRQWMFRDIEQVVHAFNKGHFKTRYANTALLRELANTKVLAGSVLHVTEKGNKSGGGGTSIINSVGNALLHLTTYYSMYCDHFGEAPCYARFSEDLSVVTYGDDVVMAISDDAKKWYSPTLHATLIKEAGCNITAPDKTAIKDEFSDLSTVEFLKNTTEYTEEGLIIPKQALATSHRILRWDKKGTENNVSVKQAKIKDALDIAQAHGEAEHADLATVVYNACAEKDRSVINAGFPWQPSLNWKLNVSEVQEETAGTWWLAHYHNVCILGTKFREVPWWQEW
eukprot:NODE_4_length_3967_cov_73.849668_g3_i0.p1 GENE.NODE_4_length_3967_cov_73.849668_g3_i0~~NODE_4_length_3967_cov_73.849668_g3_i0.p1  ORF type:complete len:1134 (+),score=186.08 NODE_4_length_3967_cov_73.849668_g3_i0:378-3779(+)